VLFSYFMLERLANRYFNPPCYRYDICGDQTIRNFAKMRPSSGARLWMVSARYYFENGAQQTVFLNMYCMHFCSASNFKIHDSVNILFHLVLVF
jgi:hypothetical protein